MDISGHPEIDEMVIGSDVVTPKAQSVDKVSQVHRTVSAGSDSEVIHIGDTVVSKHELVEAFRGTLKSGLGDIGGQGSLKFAHPAPVGLCGFALSTFVQSLVNLNARNVTNGNIVIGLGFFYGGMVQILAGMWSIAVGDIFSATAFTSYGSYWLSFAAISTESFGIRASFDNEQEFNSCMGFYLIGWFIFTFFMLLCTIRTNIVSFGLYLFMDLGFLFTATAAFSGEIVFNKVAGACGLVSCLCAWYDAFSWITSRDLTYVQLQKFPTPFAPKRYSRKTD